MHKRVCVTKTNLKKKFFTRSCSGATSTAAYRQKLQIAAAHTHTNTYTHSCTESCERHTVSGGRVARAHTHTHTFGESYRCRHPRLPLARCTFNSIAICSCHKMLQAKSKSCKRWQKLRICYWEIENRLFFYYLFLFIYHLALFLHSTLRIRRVVAATHTHTHAHAQTRSQHAKFVLFIQQFIRVLFYFILYIFLLLSSFARIPFWFFFFLFNYILSLFFSFLLAISTQSALYNTSAWPLCYI